MNHRHQIISSVIAGILIGGSVASKNISDFIVAVSYELFWGFFATVVTFGILSVIDEYLNSKDEFSFLNRIRQTMVLKSKYKDIYKSLLLNRFNEIDNVVNGISNREQFNPTLPDKSQSNVDRLNEEIIKDLHEDIISLLKKKIEDRKDIYYSYRREL